jgi:periplasmic protein TonB
MKKKLFIAVIIQMLFAPIITRAQVNGTSHCKGEFDTVLKSFIYTEADVLPNYDGKEGILGYFTHQLKMTNEDEFQGSIKLLFVVDTNGYITSARIKNKEQGSLSEVERDAIRIAQHMPKWNIGRCNGKAVPVRVSLNIFF